MSSDKELSALQETELKDGGGSPSQRPENQKSEEKKVNKIRNEKCMLWRFFKIEKNMLHTAL